MTINVLISMLIGYAFGCIQSAFFISKLFGKMDIRDYGSGNAGASNVTSIMGVKYGVIVGLIDILKGTFAVLVVKWIFPESPELAFLAGLMAIIGHMFPFYLQFRGGKGVATLVGMMIGVDWKLGLLFILLVAVPALIADFIVFGSIAAFVALPVVSFFRGYSIPIMMFSLGLTLLVFYLHRSNIQRVMAKEEVRISAVVFKKDRSE